MKGVPYVNRDKGLDLRGEPSRIECPPDQGYENKFHLLFCKIEKCKWNWVDIGEARIFFLETGDF